MGGSSGASVGAGAGAVASAGANAGAKPVKTLEEINEKIRKGDVVVVTAEEMKEIVARDGPEKAAKDVDVVTTGTFGMMSSSGAFLNFGHSEPPMKFSGGEVHLNDVPAYSGMAAVDVYIGASQHSKVEGMDYGGGHVIEDLVSKKTITLEASAYGTDCHPKKHLRTEITIEDINQAVLLNPRNAYQKYYCATNSSEKTLYTGMGMLLPNLGNITYSGAGALNPLINDMDYETIGLGTRIFLGGGVGYVVGEGTQHDPKSHMGTVMVKGDLKGMGPKYLKGASVLKYGTCMFVGVGIPIPILNAGLAKKTGIRDSEITVSVFDYGIVGKYRPPLAKVTYAQLKTGKIDIDGKSVRASSLSSYYVAREIANTLKDWIKKGKFFLSAPVERLPTERAFKRMKHTIPMVGNFMKDALKLKPEDSVKAAAKLLVENKREHIIVVNDAKEPVGMITAWEIARAVLTEKTKVSEIMTKELITARKDESIETAVRRMEYHGVSALPVLDETGKLVGVVTLKYLTNLIR